MGAIDWKKEGWAAAGLLGELIRINTTNPPGNESLACDFLKGKFAELGLATEAVESAPGRGSIVGRWRSERPEGEALILLSHLDVVPAEDEGWRHPPFSGALEDGYVWGRGAVDCKNALAAEWTALKLFRAAGHQPKRDIVLAATADEEAGGKFGVAWLVEHRPDLLQAGYCINEGGGFGVSLRDREIYFCQTGEKGVCWFKLTAVGEPGHASVPRPNTAMDRMLECLAALRRISPAVKVSRTVRLLAGGIIRALGGTADLSALPDDKISEMLLRAGRSPELQLVLSALLHNTLTITMVHGGTKTNVIPGRVEATIDCRVTPGSDPLTLLAELREIAGAFQVEVEPITLSEATEVPAEGEFYETLAAALRASRPAAVMVPFMVPGGTDGRFLVERGVKVFGFIPMLTEPGGEISALRRAHGVNERIAIADLAFAAQVLYETLVRFCG